MSDLPLDGQVAIVTGAAGGLGRVLSLGLASEGASVVCADLDEEGAGETADLVAGSGQDSLVVAVDVADEESVRQMAQATVARFGRIDILVNNAAIYATLERKAFTDISIEERDRAIDVNLRGPWLCARAAFPAMRDQQ
ncbi:MAG: SDR family oxidoreductase, partial [Actinomycetia bacterium]|nr:SDR family oxidoreductase [Actinomycetes bacterium]